MHPQTGTLWCGFWSCGVIGPYFFEDKSGNAVNINKKGKSYQNISPLNLNKLISIQTAFGSSKMAQLVIQRDIGLLRTIFQDRIISRNKTQNWPPRSYDLTPLDFFLWGYIKTKVYIIKPQTIGELEEEIRSTIRELEEEIRSTRTSVGEFYRISWSE